MDRREMSHASIDSWLESAYEERTDLPDEAEVGFSLDDLFLTDDEELDEEEPAGERAPWDDGESDHEHD